MRKYKIPLIVSVFILIVTLIYETSTSRQWIYSKMVTVFVPKLINNIEIDSNLLNANYVLLDARSEEEFKKSHLPGAIWIGDDSLVFNRANFDIGKREPRYLIYCSIGYRSQLIGKQLQDSLNFQIENLEGGIFKWNQYKFPLIDSDQNKTLEVHPYSFFWGIWRT